MKKQYWLIIGSFLVVMSCGKKSTTVESQKAPVDSIQTKTKNSDADWTGKYSNDEGDLTITNYKSGSSFDFTISIVVNTETDEPCTGEISGKAEMTDSKTAKCRKANDGGSCELQFDFDGKKQMTVYEVNCLPYHGEACLVAGTFTK
jgi:hypothetical protein